MTTPSSHLRVDVGGDSARSQARTAPGADRRRWRPCRRPAAARAARRRPGRPVVVEADRVDRARVGDGRARASTSSSGRQPAGPGRSTQRRARRRRSDVAHRRARVGSGQRRAGRSTHGDRGAPVLDDGRERIVRPSRSGSARSGATASRITPAMPPTPVQRSNAMAAWAISISDPLAARSPRARAAAQQRRLARDVDEVEHGRRRRQRARRRSSRPGSIMPTVVALTARSAVAERRRERRVVEGDRDPHRVADLGEPLEQRRRRGRRPVADGDPGGARPEAREHDRVGRPAGARHDDVEVRERPAQRQLDAGPEPGRVGVEPDQPAVVACARTLLTAPIVSASALDLVAQPGDEPLVGRGDAEARASRARAPPRRRPPPRPRPARAGRSARRCRPRRTRRRA